MREAIRSLGVFIFPIILLISMDGCVKAQQDTAPNSTEAPAKGNNFSEYSEYIVEAQEYIHKAGAENDLSFLDQAEVILHKAAKLNPKDDFTYAIWGRLYLVGGNHSEVAANAKMTSREYHLRAIPLFEKALKINPSSFEALRGLGNLYFNSELRDSRKAASYLERLVRTGEAQAYDFIHLGMCYDSLKNPEEAVRQYMAAAKVGEETKDQMGRIRALEMLGRLYTRTGKLKLAGQYLKESTKELAQLKEVHDDLYWACPYSALGDLYTKLGRPTQRAKALMEAAELEPGSVTTQFRAAWLSYRAGDYKNALKYIDRTVNLDPDTCLKQLKGYILLLQRRFHEAREFFSAKNEMGPSDTELMIGLGHLAIVGKDYEKAARLLKNAFVEEKNRFDGAATDDNSAQEMKCGKFSYKMACLGLAWTAGNQNDHLEAMRYFQLVLDVDPQELLALLGKANSLGGLHRLDEARQHYEKILTIYPENVYALAELARIYYNQGDDKAAEKAYLKALEQDPDQYTCPYEGLGLIYMRKGQIAEAKKNLKKAIEINPDIEFKKFNALAKIYMGEGRYNEAKELLGKSIENYPYDDEAKRILKVIEEIPLAPPAKKLN